MPKTVVIQIPCYNEADTLRETIADLPRSLEGISRVIVVVVDDGSTDQTTHVGLESGADYVVRHRRNRGLARAFMTGLVTALSLGADVIVNTDADHQYPGRYIADLITPVLKGEADLVIGNRQPERNIHFSPLKRTLERVGSWAIRGLSGTDAPDAASGFRAYSRYAALRLQVYNDFSYTLETLVQAGKQRMAIAHVPIHTNPARRPSRLHTGIPNFLWRHSGTIIRSYVLYQPLRSFFLLGVPLLAAGGFLITRFLAFYFTGVSGMGRYVQSVSIGGTLALFGLLLVCMGLLSDAVRANRGVMEEILIELRDNRQRNGQRSSLEVQGLSVIVREPEHKDPEVAP